MENLDDVKAGTDSAQSIDSDDPKKVDPDTQKQDQPDKKNKTDKSDKDPSDGFNFFPIESLNFHKTSVRNKELHRFRDILKSPFVNVPLLIVERQEDILPVLSLYTQEEIKKGNTVSFFL